MKPLFLGSCEKSSEQIVYVCLTRLQAQGVVIAWLVEHNTTAETRRTLRRSGCAVASKPLHASRLAPLLALATARKGMTQTSSVDSQSQPYAGGSGLTDPMGSGGFRDVGSFPRAPSSGPFHSSMRRHGGSSHVKIILLSLWVQLTQFHVFFRFPRV